MADDLVSLLLSSARSAPETLALAWPLAGGGEERWSYGHLHALVERAAEALARRGVEPGDRIALLAAPSPDFVVAALAVLRAGAMLVPINTAYRPREIAYLLADAAPRMLLVGEGERAAVDELAPAERAGVEAILGIEGLRAAADRVDDTQIGSPGARNLPAPGARALALLLYTSGTTGRSKGAELSHGNLAAMIRSLRTAWRWTAADRLLLTLPLFHLHGLVVGLFTALASGATARLEPRFDAGRVLERLACGEATLFFGVPTLYVRLVEEMRRRATAPDLSAVRLFVSGSAPLAPETFAEFEALSGQRILERYGMSETGMLLGNPLDGPRVAGSVGLPLPGVEARLVDADGAPVGPGEEGEIEVRGAGVFRGYRNAPEKSAGSFRDGWFRTGDRARIDPANGYYFLLGRASELILSGGFNVYPREIEEVLLTLPGVLEAAVVGEKHAEFGESPVAFLVADHPLDEAALAAHCRAQLAPFKRPRRFVRVERLPRNAMGKIEKRRLSELL